MKAKLTEKYVASLRPPCFGRHEVFDLLLPGFGLRITHKGTITWFVFFRLRGRLLRLTLGEFPKFGPQVARDRARYALEQVERGHDPRPLMRPTRDFTGIETQTVTGIAEEFISRHAAQRRWPEFERVVRKDVIPTIGKKQIRAVTKTDIVALLDTIIDRGAAVHANRVLTVTKRFFSWAVDRGSLDVSPAASVKKPTIEILRERVLTDAELRAFWYACNSIGWPFGPIGKLLLLTGARRDEIGEMRWSELQLKDAVLEVAAERFKSGRPFVIPLVTAALDIAEALPKIGQSNIVFTTNGERPVSGYSRAKNRLHDAMIRELRRAASNAGGDPGKVILPDWRLHDIRRTVRTRLSRLGVTPDIAERVMGHAIGGIRQRYDLHSYMDEKLAALRRWAQELLIIVERKPQEDVRLVS